MKRHIVMKDDNPLMRRVRAAEQTAALMRLVTVLACLALVIVSTWSVVSMLTSTFAVDTEAALREAAAHDELPLVGAFDVHYNDAADTLLVRMKSTHGWQRIGHVVWEVD